MSDSRLRDLERQWKASASIEDEAPYLAELVRGGVLVREKLELAAYLGHTAARNVAPSVDAPSALEGWIQGLEPWGRIVCVRAAIAAARLVLPSWEANPTSQGSGRPPDAPRRAIEAAIRWVKEPSPETQQAAASAAIFLAWPGQPPALKAAMWAALAVGPAAGAPRDTPGVAASRAANEAAGVGGESATSVRAAIAEALIPWALGRGDPLAS